MKKLKLDLDRLKVDSFEPGARTQRSKGTVFGHGTTVCTHQFSCASDGGSALDDSCGATCGGACGPQTYVMHGCTQIE